MSAIPQTRQAILIASYRDTALLRPLHCGTVTVYMYAQRAYEADVDMLFGIAICSSRRSRQRLAEY